MNNKEIKVGDFVCPKYDLGQIFNQEVFYGFVEEKLDNNMLLIDSVSTNSLVSINANLVVKTTIPEIFKKKGRTRRK